MDYVLENQSDIKVYKVSRTLARRNGKRRLLRSIYAHDHNEAVKFFDMCDFGAINGMYMLHTGDWKPIAHCFIRKEKREMTIID
ncbi:MAG: hypothetical protein IKW21_07085, partial [Lachnospiraceae bacterium]|nr:hypothetical protein [Lachnospiraceae bacterium]